MKRLKPKSAHNSTLIFALKIPGRLPSWNQILAMHHWQRKKFKDQLKRDFASALDRGVSDSLTKTTCAKNTSLISCATVASSLMMHLTNAALKSRKRSAEKASRKKSALK